MDAEKQKRIEEAKVDGYRLSLTKVLGKKIKDITFYISHEFGDRSIQVSNLIFEDDTTLHFEGEHDHPYLTDGYGDKPLKISDELLESYDAEEE